MAWEKARLRSRPDIASRWVNRESSPSVLPACRSAGMPLLRRTGRFPACRCGHQPDAHRHYRPGSDCGLCKCPRWSRCGGSHVAPAFGRPFDTPRSEPDEAVWQESEWPLEVARA
jgi:hypothetical protein